MYVRTIDIEKRKTGREVHDTTDIIWYIEVLVFAYLRLQLISASEPRPQLDPRDARRPDRGGDAEVPRQRRDARGWQRADAPEEGGAAHRNTTFTMWSNLQGDVVSGLFYA